MIKKDSKLSLLSKGKPQLAVHYEYAQKQIFNYTCMIAKSFYLKFGVHESSLHDVGVDTLEFAYTVTAVLENWARYKKLDYVPVRIFLSDWALGKYIKIRDSISVSIMTPTQNINAELVYAEEVAAIHFIDGNLRGNATMFSVVEELKSLLSPEWLELYTNGDRNELRDIVLTRLCKTYGKPRGNMKTYIDLVRALR